MWKPSAMSAVTETAPRGRLCVLTSRTPARSEGVAGPGRPERCAGEGQREGDIKSRTGDRMARRPF